MSCGRPSGLRWPSICTPWTRHCRQAMGTIADVLGEEDPQMEHMLGMQAVATHWGELPSVNRRSC